MPLFRGSGGAVFEITPPDPGTSARENFDAQVASGAIVPVEPVTPPRRRPKSTTEPEEG